MVAAVVVAAAAAKESRLETGLLLLIDGSQIPSPAQAPPKRPSCRLTFRLQRDVSHSNQATSGRVLERQVLEAKSFRGSRKKMIETSVASKTWNEMGLVRFENFASL